MIENIPPMLAEKLAHLPTTPGCYVFRNAAGEDIYVGKAKRLRQRVRSYFQSTRNHVPRTLKMVSEAADVHIIEVDSEVEALLLENRLIKDIRPRYNVLLKDDKTYPLLAISREDFPRVFMTRETDLSKVDYIGPFASMTELRTAYHYLMRIFQFRNCDLEIKDGDKKRRYFRPCLNYHIKRCSAPCTTRISRADYRGDILALRAFLRGRAKKKVIHRLRDVMATAATDMRYEDAARYRDQLKALERLAERGDLDDESVVASPEIHQQEALESLRDALGLPVSPRIIEGFDLAHLQGEHVVASEVQFVDGQPNPDGYRRFKIKSTVDAKQSGNDDYAGMAEVIGRRYKRVQEEHLPIPDVILIDGGLGQVHAAEAALKEIGLKVPCLVGLAKQEETIVFPDGRTIVLGTRHRGLAILMHVRDEAHRFCRRYYKLLHGKKFK